MAGLSAEETKALSRASQQAEMAKIKAVTESNMEAYRAACWNRLPEHTRMMICLAAGLDETLGKGPLKNLSAGDRAKIHVEARRVMHDMEVLLQCARGGKTRDHGEMAMHALDGIAAKGQMQ